MGLRVWRQSRLLGVAILLAGALTVAVPVGMKAAYAAQLDDAGYTSLAWGGVPNGMTSCGSPTGSLETYINTWPPF